MGSNYSPGDITIVVDSEPEGRYGNFKPGQKINGRVFYNPKTQVDIDNIVIVFKGICFTEIEEYNGDTFYTYPEKIVLYRAQENLFRGPYTLPPSRNQWPFQFVLPEEFDYARKSRKKDGSYQIGPQPLPPTFDSNASNPKARVTYRLKVKLNPGRVLHSAKKSHELPVWSVSPHQLPPPQALDRPCSGDGVFRSSKLRPVQLSLKEKMKHVFGNDPSLKTPCIHISVSAKTPRTAGISQLMPTEISCKYHRNSDVDPKDPVIILAHVDIALKSYIDVRSKGTIADHTRDLKVEVASRSIPGRKIQMPLDGSFVELQPFSLADLKKSPQALVPSFQTFTINLYYKLNVTVWLRHADTGHIWKFEQKNPFQILVEDAPNMDRAPAYPGTYQKMPLQIGMAPYQEGSAMPRDEAHVPSYNADGPSTYQPPPTLQDAPAPPSYGSRDVWQPVTKSKVY